MDKSKASSFESTLTTEWKSWYQSSGKGAPKNKVEGTERRTFENGLCALYNPSLN